MTKKPPARLSRPRTGPAAPTPAHGDGPTGPSAPTGHTEPPRDLRERLADALRHAEHVCDEDCERRDHTYLPFDQEDPERRTTVHTTTGAILDAVLPIVGAETAALRERAENAEDRLRKATDAYTQLHAATTGTEATGDRWRQRAEEAERERDTAREALDAAAIVIASLRDQRDQARDAIAHERRGRLAAEAAVRRVRALHQPTQGQGYDCDEDDTPGSYGDIAQVCTSCGTADEYGVRWPCPTIAALDAEQPKETR